MMVKIGTFRLIEEVEPKPRLAFIQPGQERSLSGQGQRGASVGRKNTLLAHKPFLFQNQPPQHCILEQRRPLQHMYLDYGT
jgi:hypothetical protein